MVQIKADRTTEMATFLAVVCAGSLSAAARELDLTPSAVSRIVTRIEERLGVRLVLRTTRSLRLTAEGESYARVARRVLADLDEMESTIADRGSPRGQIRVRLGGGRDSARAAEQRRRCRRGREQLSCRQPCGRDGALKSF